MKDAFSGSGFGAGGYATVQAPPPVSEMSVDYQLGRLAESIEKVIGLVGVMGDRLQPVSMPSVPTPNTPSPAAPCLPVPYSEGLRSLAQRVDGIAIHLSDLLNRLSL